MKLVDHQAFKTVGNRVKIIDPSSPAAHVLDIDRKTSVDDQGKDHDSCGRKSLGQGPTKAGDRSEEHGHNHSKAETDEHEEEIWPCVNRQLCSHSDIGWKLLTRLSSQVGHKVQRQVEADAVKNLIRDIRKGRRNSFGRRMVEGVS